MKNADVKVGSAYLARVSGRRTVVRITAESQHGGWYAVNLKTGKPCRIKTARRLTELSSLTR